MATDIGRLVTAVIREANSLTGLKWRKEDNYIVLRFANQREQKVSWDECDGHIRLTSRVLRPSDARCFDVPSLTWERNRTIDFLKFAMDDSDWLVVRAFLPMEDANSSDLRFLIERTAEEADRLEYLLTGQDRE